MADNGFMVQNSFCCWCHLLFSPNPRLGKRQKCCGLSECRKKQKHHSHSLWKSRNKQIYRAGLKDWRVDHPGYWKNYRQNNPAYTQRNRSQAKIRWNLSRITLQKRIDILQLTEKQMEYWKLAAFAKQPRSLVPLLYAKLSLTNSLTCFERPP